MPNSRKIVKELQNSHLGAESFVFYDTESNRQYRRVLGGVGFSFQSQANFYVIVGENAHKVDRLGVRNYYVLAENSGRDPESFLKSMIDAQYLYNIDTWFSDLSDVLHSHMVDSFNIGRKQTQSKLIVINAPYSGVSGNGKVYSQIIKSRLVRGKKTLFLGGSSSLPNVLLGMKDEELEKKVAREFVSFSALGYAVAALDAPYYDSYNTTRAAEHYINRRTVKGL